MHNALAPALAAVAHAANLCNLLGVYADEIENVSRGAREATRELLREDMRACSRALAEAARLLSIDDPLGCVDSSEAYRELAEARAVYHAALVAFGADPLSLAA